MERQSDYAKVKNVLAFLALLFGEKDTWREDIMDIPPDYLLEKFNRYVHRLRDESPWGMHPSLKRGTFDRYCEKWEIPNVTQKNDSDKDEHDNRDISTT
jgi:hypothetical protein